MTTSHSNFPDPNLIQCSEVAQEKPNLCNKKALLPVGYQRMAKEFLSEKFLPTKREPIKFVVCGFNVLATLEDPLSFNL